MAPPTEPMPPSTVNTNVSMLRWLVNEPPARPRCWCTKTAPEKPASAPDTAKALSLSRMAETPKLCTFASFSRMAMSSRPKRLRRRLSTTTIASTSAAMLRKYIERSFSKSRKNSRGRSMLRGSNQSKYWSLNNVASIVIENARVLTARNSPLSRSAGMPMSMANAPAKIVAIGTANQNGTPTLLVSAPPTTAPMAAKPICPRLIWPAQPVSTTNESPMMACTRIVAPRNWRRAGVMNGQTTRKIRITPTSTMRVVRTVETFESSFGMPRCSRTAAQETPVPSSLRCPRRRWSSSVPVSRRKIANAMKPPCWG